MKHKYKVGDKVILMGFDSFDGEHHFSGSICFVDEIREDGTYDLQIDPESSIPFVPEDQIYNLEDAIPALVNVYNEATAFECDEEDELS